MIKVKSGAKFPKDELDWAWWHPSVPGKIKEAHASGSVNLPNSSSTFAYSEHPG